MKKKSKRRPYIPPRALALHGLAHLEGRPYLKPIILGAQFGKRKRK